MTTRQIVGHWTHIDGTPATGVVWFSPSATLSDPTNSRIIVNTPIPVILDSTGRITIDLICTDTPGLTPDDATTWTWDVAENIQGDCHTYTLEVPTGNTPITLTNAI